MKKGSDKTSHAKSKKKWETFNSKFWWRFGPFLLLLGVICWFPYWFTQFHWVNYDLRDYGTLGDAINGIMGPFIAMIAAGLTFIAFWVQYRANEQQRDDISLERFETKYYEMIRLHKENVNEIRLSEKRFGRKAFVALYEELRLCFSIVKDSLAPLHDIVDDKQRLGFERTDDEAIFRIAYVLFFVGAGTGKPGLIVEQAKGLATENYLNHLDDYIRDIKKNTNRFTFKVGIVDSTFEFDYPAFMGHIADLGHYYRHLYQTVKFIDESEELSDDQKYKYVKALRAQLSSYEQILLYYNTFSRFGKPWLDGVNPYLIKYRMIKNIPLPLADFGVKPEDKFKDEVERTKDSPDKFFEWHEV